MRTLTIISHTEHYRLADGRIVGLGATVTEINHLLEIFDRILHVAMLHDEEAPPSSLAYASEKIIFRALPAVGGKSLVDKLAIVYQAPKILGVIRAALQESDYFQFRAPTGIGVYVLPYLVFCSNKKGWFKYAGNWKQEQAPLAYGFQRWFLQKQKRKVTINGKWEGQPKHCLTFENPCLSNQELKEGAAIREKKTLEVAAIQLCFVGRLEKEKGLDLFLEALEALTDADKAKLHTVHIVGDGKTKRLYEQSVEGSALPIVFHGFLSRETVHSIYKQSHAIVLPSASEGFPKVIAEAMNYGCVPIVSNVSSIGYYIRDAENGFLLSDLHALALKDVLSAMLKMHPTDYKRLASPSSAFIERFSYAYYNQQLLEHIL